MTAERPRSAGTLGRPIALFRQWGEQGRPSSFSSHILHEVDQISDQVILLSQGYVVAEGQNPGRPQRGEGPAHADPGPLRPARDAGARLFQQDHIVEAKIHADGTRTAAGAPKTPTASILLLNRVILDSGLEVESVAPADDDVNSVYQYLIGGEGSAVLKPDRRRAAAGDEEDLPFETRIGGFTAWRWHPCFCR